MATFKAGAFGAEVQRLRQCADVVVLQDELGQAKIAVVPQWQGRVMTSTATGDGGASYGWINHELIESRKLQPHINAFGGEDRFWLGPEGGQFSIFFAKGAPFVLDHWFTPAAIDTMPYRTTERTASSIRFAVEFSLTNYSETAFDVAVDREVRLLAPSMVLQRLHRERPDASVVAFETVNTIANRGPQTWTKETGMLSIWSIGMFPPSRTTTIVVPIMPGPDCELGPRVTSNYFGEIPSARLTTTDRTLFFDGDGQFRSKIGISPRRSRGVLGSYDAATGVLTIVQFTQPAGAVDYVNSLWELQDHPYAGDAANCYNDGPPAPGTPPLGPFYELESSSPAAGLAPGQSLTHVHRTIHATGPRAAVDAIAREALGVTLAEIEAALPK